MYYHLLGMDVDLKNPEITLSIDRERALIEGVSTAQIGMQIRTALFGKEISKIKEGKEEYKIQVKNIKQCPSEVFEQIIIRTSSDIFESHCLEQFYKRIYLNAINALDEASNEIIKLIKEQRNKRYCLPQFMKNFEKFHRENSKIILEE